MDQTEERLMTKFLNNFKNPTFGRFSSFKQNLI